MPEAVDISYCVVNTNGGKLLEQCLGSIERSRLPDGVHAETLVLDNASDDGSEKAARERPDVQLIALDQRQGKAESDSQLLQSAGGRYCLLLNEDVELQPDAAALLYGALEADESAGAAGALLLNADGIPQPCAWRFTGVGSALAGALMLHKWLTVQSGGSATRRVDWHQSSALLVRREAAEAINWLDSEFFVYGDEVDFCKRLADCGWHTLHVPAAKAFHREGLSTGAGAQRRIIQFHRGRDLYMRKHHGRSQALVVRGLVAWTYLMRAAAAAMLPSHSAARYLQHVRAALTPWHGEGMKEAAEQFNRERR